ncbi:MAG TPA: hypothetical protein ENH86_01085 [Candidatus Jorgensenbacteria bacterium]|nr:hypothetical protein [Candidatus Jorgensenbacteria bacterium]
MKRYTTIILLIVFLSIGQHAVAQTLDVQKALDDTKESLGDLVTAKDEDSPLNVALRIETFKKVVELSLSEAKDFKIKLLVLDDIDDEALLAWKERMVTALNEAITYYETQHAYIKENGLSIDLEEIQTIAADFKAWRETYYLPAYGQIQVFLFIQKEERILAIAQSRWGKIEQDIARLERAGLNGIDELRELLSAAGDYILLSKQEYSAAAETFAYTYTAPFLTTSTIEESEATSTDTTIQMLETTITPTSSDILDTSEPRLQENVGEETVETTTSTDVVAPVSPITSIKDLVRSSLQNVKRAYQVFIEMSSLVRKLL